MYKSGERTFEEIVFCSGNYTDEERFHHKAGVFRTLFFIATILYITEELLEDLDLFFPPGVTPPLNSASSPPAPLPSGEACGRTVEHSRVKQASLELRFFITHPGEFVSSCWY